MCSNPLPTLITVEKLMQCLLGNQVEARNSAPGPDLNKPHVVASYVDDAQAVQRVLVNSHLSQSGRYFTSRPAPRSPLGSPSGSAAPGHTSK